jgi:hypothetical protein
MLCPRCGAPLYVRAVEVLSGMPVFLEEDEIGIRVEFNGDDATHSQCDGAVEYCEKCGWSSDTPDANDETPEVEDTALRRFFSAVQARFIALRSEKEKLIRYEDDMTTVAIAVAEVLEPEGFNVEPTQWCAITHPEVREDEEAHVIPTQDILNWMGDDLRREVVNHFPGIGASPLRFLPVPHGMVCCAGRGSEFD